MEKISSNHLIRLIKYIQVVLFVSGMCVIQFLQFFVASPIPFNIATLLIFISILFQISNLKISGETNNTLRKLKEQYLIPFTLSGICMFLNYQYIAVAPYEIYKSNLPSAIVGMIRFPLQIVAYGLMTYASPYVIQLNIYLGTIVYWICANAYQTIGLIQKISQQSEGTSEGSYLGQQKDIGICLLGIITGNAIIMMDLALRQKPRIKKGSNLEIQLTSTP